MYVAFVILVYVIKPWQSLQQDIRIWFAPAPPRFSRQFKTHSKMSITSHKIAIVNRPMWPKWINVHCIANMVHLGLHVFLSRIQTWLPPQSFPNDWCAPPVWNVSRLHRSLTNIDQQNSPTSSTLAVELFACLARVDLFIWGWIYEQKIERTNQQTDEQMRTHELMNVLIKRSAVSYSGCFVSLVGVPLWKIWNCFVVTLDEEDNIQTQVCRNSKLGSFSLELSSIVWNNAIINLAMTTAISTRQEQ